MFSKLTEEKIGYYVYCLNYPGTGNTFYIGKGIGNRVLVMQTAILKTIKTLRKLK